MADLYCSCGEHSRAAVAMRLGDTAQDLGVSNGQASFHVTDPTEAQLRQVMALLDEKLMSAILSEKPPPAAALAKALQQRGVLLTTTNLAERVDRIGPRLQADARSSHGFTVLRVVRPPLRADRVGAPSLTTRAVQNNKERYYGELTGRPYCGANALFATGVEMARWRGEGEARVLVPKAGAIEPFGFKRCQDEASVIALRAEQRIAIRAWSFALDDWGVARPPFVGEVDEEQIEKDHPIWRKEGLRYGLAIELIEQEGQACKVVIPLGSVYQPSEMELPDHSLAAARRRVVPLGPRAAKLVVLPAWCLHRTRQASAPGTMVLKTPTCLVATNGIGSQRDIWDVIAQRYDGRLRPPRGGASGKVRRRPGPRSPTRAKRQV